MTPRFICRISKLPLCSTWNGQSAFTRPVRTLCSDASLVVKQDNESTNDNEGLISMRDSPAFSSYPPISPNMWECFRQEANKFAADHGSIFHDKVYPVVIEEKLNFHVIECNIDDLKPTEMNALILPSSCNLLHHEKEARRHSYYHALIDEAKREKLYMEYLVKEFEHSEWLSELLIDTRVDDPLDFLSINCPYVSRVSLVRGLKLHMSKIPYEYLTLPLPQFLRKRFLEHIERRYRIVGYIILKQSCPTTKLMSVKVQAMHTLARLSGSINSFLQEQKANA